MLLMLSVRAVTYLTITLWDRIAMTGGLIIGQPAGVFHLIQPETKPVERSASALF